MPYTPTNWQDGVTPVNQSNMNHAETQYAEASSSYEAELLNPFVLTGYTPSKDGTNANQLDVTQGTAYVKQADNTLRRRTSNGAPGPYLTVTPSTTYYLDLNPDGSFSWGTSHSGQPNYLTICSVATDGSGNISSVTDARMLSPELLPAAAGPLRIPVNRGGSIVLIEFYTSSSTPVGDGVNTPATGAIWVKA